MPRTTAGGLRRAPSRGFEGGTARGPRPALLRYGDVALDPWSHTASRADRPLHLTPIEFTLLELFLRHPGEVLTRHAIFESVWGYDFGATSNSLAVYVGYVRRKLERDGERRLLHTVRGVGYVLR